MTVEITINASTAMSFKDIENDFAKKLPSSENLAEAKKAFEKDPDHPDDEEEAVRKKKNEKDERVTIKRVDNAVFASAIPGPKKKLLGGLMKKKKPKEDSEVKVNNSEQARVEQAMLLNRLIESKLSHVPEGVVDNVGWTDAARKAALLARRGAKKYGGKFLSKIGKGTRTTAKIGLGGAAVGAGAMSVRGRRKRKAKERALERAHELDVMGALKSKDRMKNMSRERRHEYKLAKLSKR